MGSSDFDKLVRQNYRFGRMCIVPSKQKQKLF
jgi:hypothetical protein